MMSSSELFAKLEGMARRSTRRLSLQYALSTDNLIKMALIFKDTRKHSNGDLW
jgi:hypothetical protein